MIVESSAIGIKITGCKDPLLWYAQKVGEVVPFMFEESDVYMSREPVGYLNIVYKQDAELVKINTMRAQNENTKK